MSFLKTLLAFVFGLVIASAMLLVFMLLNVQIPIDMDLVMNYGALLFYATLHKLGVVAFILSLMYYFLPEHWPKNLLVILTSAPLAIVYNYAFLRLTQNGALIDGLAFSEVFINFLLYFGIVAIGISLVATLVIRQMQKRAI